MTRAATSAAAVMLLVGALASHALADGDPASDVLATQTLFLPWDANVPIAQRAQLGGLLQTARHDGFPIRVALIATESDLGSLTALWRQPRQYAQFLAQELSLLYKGALLIVMPNGFGLAGFYRPSASLQAALHGLPRPAAGAALAQVTINAVRRVAAATGHPLPAVGIGTRAGVNASATRPTAAIEWIVFAVGALGVAAAWTASLRAMPLRAPRKGSSPI